MKPVLLDTCAVLWLANRSAIAPQALETLRACKGIYASPVSAWEIGELAARRRLSLSMEAAIWWDILLDSGVRLAPMDAATLIAASALPGGRLKDPADRIIVATARRQGLTIMTRDRPILNYAAAGHVQAIAC